MGLIRKSLAVGSLGVVHGSSKKQRTAKATQKAAQASVRIQSQLLEEQRAADLSRQRAEQARVQADRERDKAEHDFKYATDPVYKQYVDDKKAEEVRLAAVEHQRRLQLMAAAEAQRIEQRAADQARRAKQAQRRQERLATAGAALTTVALLTFVVAGVAALAVLVWTPQLAVSSVRHEPFRPWNASRLRSLRDRALHSHAPLTGGDVPATP